MSLWNLPSSVALAATVTVKNTNDSGSGSLRDAIAQAASGDTIKFHLTAVPATIILISPLSISTGLTISGPGASNLAISGNKAVQVLTVASGITVGISGVTIENAGNVFNFGGGGIFNQGTLTLTSSTVTGNMNQYGGGIFNEGTLTLIKSTVSGNVGDLASGIANSGGAMTLINSTVIGNSGIGSGINNGGTLTLINSIVSGNSGGYNGGGISNSRALTLINSTVSGNSGDFAGGIYNGNTLTLTNSTVSGNVANHGNGGGIYNGNTLTLTSSTVSGNTAGSLGGGIFNLGITTLTGSTVSNNNAGLSRGGGGIYNGSTLTITNSTISGNSSTGSAGIYNGGTLAITNSTVSGNVALYFGAGIYDDGTLTMKSTIVANNSAGLFGDLGNCYIASPTTPIPGNGSSTSYGHNLSDDNSCSSFFNTAIGDINNTPAGLDPSGLQNNGGSTQTIALLPTSSAVNAIPVNYCTAIDGVTPVATDQRGIPRPQGSGCDIGAFEFLAIAAPAPTSGATCDGAYTGTFRGNITVSAGQNCIFLNGGATGNVQQRGGTFSLLQGQVGGNLDIDGASTFSIGSGSTIHGNVQIQNLLYGSDQNQICGTTVGGNLQVQNNQAAVLVGSNPPSACTGNVVGGNLEIQNNWAGTTVAFNTVSGNLVDQNNIGLTQVFGNTVSGNLSCQNNIALQGGSNVVNGQTQGQCKGF